MDQAQWPNVAQSAVLQAQITNAKVLCIGAGGIGCELLKTLVLTGFLHIHVIDMDTIETSNLNRQFLFRKQHVGQSKASVAAQAVKLLRPKAQIMAQQADIKQSEYGVEFFRGFSLVLNGLDNLEARRHVNRLCLAAEVPLVESGTQGYLGQATVHLKGRSQCFECQPKSAPKTFPVCTIRNTPDKPIHCIVWAKELLFQRLFGSPEAVTDLDEGAAPQAPTEGPADGAASSSASAQQAADDASAFLRRDDEHAEDYARRIFGRVFQQDIERVLGMEDLERMPDMQELWKTRSRPTPLRLAELVPSAAAPTSDGREQQPGEQPSACRSLGLNNHHQQWDLKQNAQLFLEAIRLFVEQRAADIGAAVFDKDDALAVEFVVAAANLRAIAYGIPTQTLFDAKGMAGNIIHAIATTNAVIAGFIVLEALKLLAGTHDVCKTSFLLERPAGNRRKVLVRAMALDPPNPGCMVCGTAQLQLRINTATATLAHFINKVLKQRLSMQQPSIMAGDFLYEEGEGLEPDEVEEFAAHLSKPLQALPGGGIGHDAIVQVDDQAQHLRLDIVVTHQEAFDEELCPEGFLLAGKVPEATAEAAATGGQAASTSGPAAEAEDDFYILEAGKAADGAAINGASQGSARLDDKGKGKRKASPLPSPRKRLRPGSDDDAIMLD